MHSTPNHRRWFRFSLRTLLLLVAILAAFLAYHLQWIRSRQQRVNDPKLLFVVENRQSFVRAPGLLWLFGEQGWALIEVEVEGPTLAQLSDADLRKGRDVRRLFPEAEIRARHIVEHNDRFTRTWYAPFPWTPEMQTQRVTTEKAVTPDLLDPGVGAPPAPAQPAKPE
jgi:hypothetical protein